MARTSPNWGSSPGGCRVPPPTSRVRRLRALPPRFHVNQRGAYSINPQCGGKNHDIRNQTNVAPAGQDNIGMDNCWVLFLKQCAKWRRLQFPFSNNKPNAKKNLPSVSDGQDIRDGFSRRILDSRAQNKFQFRCYVPTTRIQHEMTFLPPVQGCGVSQFTTIERVGTD